MLAVGRVREGTHKSLFRVQMGGEPLAGTLCLRPKLPVVAPRRAAITPPLCAQLPA